MLAWESVVAPRGASTGGAKTVAISPMSGGGVPHYYLRPYRGGCPHHA